MEQPALPFILGSSNTTRASRVDVCPGQLNAIEEIVSSLTPDKRRLSGQVVHIRTLSKKLLFMDVVLDRECEKPVSWTGDRFELVATARDGHSIESIAALTRGVRTCVLTPDIL